MRKNRLAVFMLALMGAGLVISGCPARQAPPPESRLTFSVVGEIRPSAGETSFFEKASPLGDLRASLFERDLVMADVAGGFEFGCQPLAQDVLKWETGWLSTLEETNIRVLSLADDHSLDCGREALRKGLDHLVGLGYSPVGAGRARREAAAPIYLTKPGITISVVAFLLDPVPGLEPCDECTGPAVYKKQDLTSALQEMGKRSDFRIVVLHLSERELPRLSQDEIKVIREAVDFGADLVLCYGPRSAGGLYRIRGKWVLASLGMLTGHASQDPARAADSIILSAEFGDNHILNLRIAPVSAKSGTPTVLRGDEAKVALEKMLENADTEAKANTKFIGDILYLK